MIAIATMTMIIPERGSLDGVTTAWRAASEVHGVDKCRLSREWWIAVDKTGGRLA
jgi:hypothetical protein